MKRLFLSLCLTVPAPGRIEPPPYLPDCFPVCLFVNHRTAYVLDGEEVERGDVLPRWEELKLIQMRQSGGWIRLMRFGSGK